MGFNLCPARPHRLSGALSIRIMIKKQKSSYGMLGKKHSEKTKQKLREKSLKQFENGMPEQTKKKMSLSHMGLSPSEETRKKMSDNNWWKGKFGEKSSNWKGGRKKNKQGYWRIYIPNKFEGYEHIYLMEQKLKRKLTKEEIVHHINYDRSNNRIENLYLFSTKKQHSSYEANVRATYFKWITAEKLNY